jgi:hypothetical protein
MHLKRFIPKWLLEGKGIKKGATIAKPITPTSSIQEYFTR